MLKREETNVQCVLVTGVQKKIARVVGGMAVLVFGGGVGGGGG